MAALLKAPIWLQIVLFIVSGIVLLITTKPFIEKLMNSHKENTKTNTDLIIGKNAVVLEDIDNIREEGAVKIDGKVWTARNFDGTDVIPKGELVRIVEIQGVKLMCTINK